MYCSPFYKIKNEKGSCQIVGKQNATTVVSKYKTNYILFEMNLVFKSFESQRKPIFWTVIEHRCCGALFGSGRRIRTLTNGVRVRCATITQFR